MECIADCESDFDGDGFDLKRKRLPFSFSIIDDSAKITIDEDREPLLRLMSVSVGPIDL